MATPTAAAIEARNASGDASSADRTAAGATLVFWGVLGLASIGIPILVGAFLAASAAVRSAENASPDAFRASIAVVVGVAAALVLAYALT